MLNELYTAKNGTLHVVKVVNVVREITKGEKIENTAITQQVLLQRQKFYNFGKETLNEDDLDFEEFSMELELFLGEYQKFVEVDTKKPKIKTGIKMRVTPEQNVKVQKISSLNGKHKKEYIIEELIEFPCIFIDEYLGRGFVDKDYFEKYEYEEVDPELFIRTNGTCEEDPLCGAEELKTIKHVLQDMEAPQEDDGAYDFNDFEVVESDPINPTHYQIGGIETIDYIEAKLTPEQYKGYCKGNSIKYLSRAGHKGEEIEDYKKAAWYLNRLLEIAQKGDSNG